jgi:Tol biopolymer transport system component
LKITNNGDKVVFSAQDASGFLSIYLLNTQQKEITKLVTGSYNIPESWSLNESEILFTNIEKRSVHLINIENMNEKTLDLQTDESLVHAIRWSSDGKLLAFSRVQNMQQSPIQVAVFIYNLLTNKITQITDYDMNCQNPKWSPVENKVLSHCAGEEVGKPFNYILKSALNDLGDLEGKPVIFSGCEDATWSPDGIHFIATYCKGKDSVMPLAVFDSDGSIVKVFLSSNDIDNAQHITEIAWSPDGQKVIYTAGKDKNSLNIYIVNIDGSNNHAITTQLSNYSNLSIFAIP